MDFNEFQPKKILVPVGEIQLNVKEFTIAKRDAIIKIILSGIDIIPLMRPFWEAVKSVRNIEDAESVQIDLTQVAAQLKETVLQFLANDLTLISCVALDVHENRLSVYKERLADMDEEKIYREHPTFGFDFMPKFFKWIRNNLTPKQEVQLIEAIFKVNEFGELLKNYKTLVMTGIGAVVAGAEKEDLVEQQKLSETPT